MDGPATPSHESTPAQSLRWESDLKTMRQAVWSTQRGGQTVGFVPTMGNLHAGHLALIKRACDENDMVVVSIFVNPTQFGPNEDFHRYPRTPDEDRQACQDLGVDWIFAPSADVMYPEGSLTEVKVAHLPNHLCGENRPGHFDGVATVVSKLFNIVPANKAYFGEKDYQQLRLIEQMVRDLNFPIEIVPCPIVREPDGLAMSSRNQYLSEDERQEAVVLSRALLLGRNAIAKGQLDADRIRLELADLISSSSSGEIDYIAVVDPTHLTQVYQVEGPVRLAVAVRFGQTRLIDNVLAVPPAMVTEKDV